MRACVRACVRERGTQRDRDRYRKTREIETTCMGERTLELWPCTPLFYMNNNDDISELLVLYVDSKAIICKRTFWLE